MQLFGQSMDRPQKERKQIDSMITRSNLADQLREYQVRSQHNWASLSFFSSTGQIASRSDSTRARLWLFLFFVLLIFSFIALYLRYTWPAVGFVCFAIFLPICLKIIRHFKLARKRQRRMLYLYPCKPEDVLFESGLTGFEGC